MGSLSPGNIGSNGTPQNLAKDKEEDGEGKEDMQREGEQMGTYSMDAPSSSIYVSSYQQEFGLFKMYIHLTTSVNNKT